MNKDDFKPYQELAVAVIRQAKKEYLADKMSSRALNGLYFWAEIVMNFDLIKLKREFKKQYDEIYKC